MFFDAHKNFCKVLVSQGYNASATGIILSSGDGAKCPAVPFNLTWYDSTVYDDPADDPNVERVRVTAITSDTLTVTRGVDGTTAKTHNTTDSQYVLVLAVGVSELEAIEAATASGGLSVQRFRLGPGPSMAQGVLAKGANLLPLDYTYVTIIEDWANAFPAQVKPQLDLMSADGFTMVRLASGMGGIATGDITRDEFYAAMDQYIQYCAKVGLYVYITAADCFSALPTSYDESLMPAIKTEVVAYAAFCDKYPNVVCIDLFNEFFYDGGFMSGSGLTFGQRATIAIDWSSAVRAVTNIPVTWSLPTSQDNGSSAMWNATAISELNTVSPALDFVDMHVYYDVVSSDLVNYLAALSVAKPSGMPMIIGECGMPSNTADATRAARLARTGKIVNDCQLVGGLMWAFAEGSGPAGGNWGLYHADLTTPYPLALAAVKGWPKQLSPRASDIISVPSTIYASVSGNDSNDGMSAATPKTLQGCADFIKGKNIKSTLVVQLANSTSYQFFNLYGYTGAGLVILRGNVSNKDAVKIDTGGTAPCVGCGDQGDYRYQIEYISFHSGHQFDGPIRFSGGHLTLGNGNTFVAEDASAVHIYVVNGARFDWVDNCLYYVTGGCLAHIQLEDGGKAFFGRASIVATGTVNFSTCFALIQVLASAQMYSPDGSITVSGGTITGQKWQLNANSVLKTFGSEQPDNYFPGNSNGAKDTTSSLIIS